MTEIWIKFREERVHWWPGAPLHRSYLGNRHRHLFHVTVQTCVGHDDREIEFHDLLDEARSRFAEMVPLASPMSCEHMARQLGSRLSHHYQRTFRVEVSEDGECGAIVTTEHKKRAPADAEALDDEI